MKAIRVHEFGDSGVMKIQEIPMSEPGPGQVLIDVKSAGVNPVDTYIRAGAYAKKPDLPYTPGFDAAGIVNAVGTGVEGISIGDRVYAAGTISGSYAEKALCADSQIHRLPDNVPFGQGASIGIPCAIAYHALFRRAKAMAGETVLVHGATGGVGIAAVQLAKACGLKVIGTAGTDKGKDFVLKLGANYVANHRDSNYMDEIMSMTNNQGVDLVLEMLANINLGNDLKILKQYGRVVVIGSQGPVEMDPRDIMIREATIMGVLLFNLPQSELASIHSGLVAALQTGILKPVVGKEFDLVDAPLAHEEIMHKKVFGKIILKT